MTFREVELNMQWRKRYVQSSCELYLGSNKMSSLSQGDTEWEGFVFQKLSFLELAPWYFAISPLVGLIIDQVLHKVIISNLFPTAF